MWLHSINFIFSNYYRRGQYVMFYVWISIQVYHYYLLITTLIVFSISYSYCFWEAFTTKENYLVKKRQNKIYMLRTSFQLVKLKNKENSFAIYALILLNLLLLKVKALCASKIKLMKELILSALLVAILWPCLLKTCRFFLKHKQIHRIRLKLE